MGKLQCHRIGEYVLLAVYPDRIHRRIERGTVDIPRSIYGILNKLEGGLDPQSTVEPGKVRPSRTGGERSVEFVACGGDLRQIDFENKCRLGEG